ncbi:MAG: hypothetical protein C7B45_00420 [Sulfobacillus acidophilus]|uniref:Guanylate cyclase domain-containing protein n=1 Tax=Sulfobacillus acidophilus TaxID=53633 RepID=A0A2T2WPN4_9FIRM|nr:MAG: hypothetical protein C7B45_00420 [Sulfobacillus acidophilus]
MLTGTLVGAVVAGFWILRRPQRRFYGRTVRQARRLAPVAYKVARYGGTRLVHLAKRRLS